MRRFGKLFDVLVILARIRRKALTDTKQSHITHYSGNKQSFSKQWLPKCLYGKNCASSRKTPILPHFLFPLLYKTLILYNCSYIFLGRLLPTFVSQELVEKKKKGAICTFFCTFFHLFPRFSHVRKARTSPSLFARGRYYYLLRVSYIYYIYYYIAVFSHLFHLFPDILHLLPEI